jgi:hypothetical protein
MVKTFEKYGLLNLVISAVESGIMMPLNVFKRYVTNVVKVHEHRCFNATCIMYPTLSLFTQCINSVDMWKWWCLCSICPELTRKVKAAARLLFKQTCFAGSTYRFTPNASKSCIMCDNYNEESAEHVLFECTNDAYQTCRAKFNSDLKVNAPAALLVDLSCMASKEKLLFFLGCLNNSLIIEWLPLYACIVNFLYDMYMIQSKYVKDVSIQKT